MKLDSNNKNDKFDLLEVLDLSSYENLKYFGLNLFYEDKKKS